MQEGDDKYLYKDLSYQIVGASYDVFNELGYGYLEKHYQKAMACKFDNLGLKYKQQQMYEISLPEKTIGKYFFDFLVEEQIVVELKKGNYFPRGNIIQTKAYLEISKLKLAIIINFTSNGVKFMRILNNN